MASKVPRLDRIYTPPGPGLSRRQIYRDMVPRQIRTKRSLLVLKRKIQPKKGHFKNFAAQHASRDPAFLVLGFI